MLVCPVEWHKNFMSKKMINRDVWHTPLIVNFSAVIRLIFVFKITFPFKWEDFPVCRVVASDWNIANSSPLADCVIGNENTCSLFVPGMRTILKHKEIQPFHKHWTTVAMRHSIFWYNWSSNRIITYFDTGQFFYYVWVITNWSWS